MYNTTNSTLVPCEGSTSLLCYVKLGFSPWQTETRPVSCTDFTVFIPEVDVIVMKKNHANVWIVPTCTWTPIGIITYIIDNQTFLYIKLVVLKNIIEDWSTRRSCVNCNCLIINSSSSNCCRPRFNELKKFHHDKIFICKITVYLYKRLYKNYASMNLTCQ